MEIFGITLPSYGWETVLGSAISGVFLGSIYALVVLGLTLIYGVLHIVNFAQGALLMLAMYAVYYLWSAAGIAPYLAMLIVVPGGFAFGYLLQRFVIGRASHGRDEITLLVTLGVSIVIENAALAGSLAITAALWLFMARSDTGKAIRAVAHEPQGARLVGIDVEHIFAITFGLGIAIAAAAASLVAPTYPVHPQIGNLFVLIAFTAVVLGGGQFRRRAGGWLPDRYYRTIGSVLHGRKPGGDHGVGDFHPGSVAAPHRPFRPAVGLGHVGPVPHHRLGALGHSPWAGAARYEFGPLGRVPGTDAFCRRDRSGMERAWRLRRPVFLW